MYIEASQHRQGEIAQLSSSNFNVGSSPMCLEFWYHMYGANQGQLAVKVQGNAMFMKNGECTM